MELTFPNKPGLLNMPLPKIRLRSPKSDSYGLVKRHPTGLRSLIVGSAQQRLSFPLALGIGKRHSNARKLDSWHSD